MRSTILIATLISAISADCVCPAPPIVSNPPVVSLPVTNSAFKLVQSYSGSTFLDGWKFWTDSDPTHGQVNFVDRNTAAADRLAYTTSSGSTVLKVDDTTFLAQGINRNSVRISSLQTVKIGSIIIMDAVKMPYGPSVWPAFWSYGANWPNGGEIDIVEGVHNNKNNIMTLHTTPGCTLQQPMIATGNIMATDCNVAVNGNTGCSVQDPSTNSYGAGFNAVGGGVYVMYWDTTGISIWFFVRGAVPADITAGQPNIQNWGTPKGKWGSGTCNMNQYFAEQNLIFDITLCGEWAGATFNSAGFEGTCSNYVANPGNYHTAAFEINSVKVYHQ